MIRLAAFFSLTGRTPYLLLLCSFFCFSWCSAQQRSLLPENKRQAIRWQKELTAPLALISVGLLATTNNNIINRKEIREERNEALPRFRVHADDYLQYSPIAAVYALNALGIKGEHDFATRSALLIRSELIMVAIVFPLKKITAVPRPDTGQPTSFPSGHTAQAFAAATFLHKEYGREHPGYSVLAYGMATGIGALRVMNNRHWASDVLAGAGIGILATNLAYLTYGKNHNAKRNSPLLVPAYASGAYGMSMILPLK